jgi:transcriptional antiterminator NusG
LANTVKKKKTPEKPEKIKAGKAPSKAAVADKTQDEVREEKTSTRTKPASKAKIKPAAKAAKPAAKTTAKAAGKSTAAKPGAKAAAKPASKTKAKARPAVRSTRAKTVSKAGKKTGRKTEPAGIENAVKAVKAKLAEMESAGAGVAVAEMEPGEPQEIIEIEKDPRCKWYVIHTYSGYENKVKANLQRRISSLNMQDKIFQVLVPTEEEIEFKDGKKKTVQKKIYPGYVLVEMIMTDDSWYVVRNTSGVTGFVGPGVKPIPLPDDEVKKILRMMGMEAPIKLKMDLMTGQMIRVNHGPFKDFHGIVEEVNTDREKVRVHISFLGRETPVELDFSHIEKV